jgi:hypothetical protein
VPSGNNYDKIQVATKWRHGKARHGSAGRPEVVQTESALADGTSLVTARLAGTSAYANSFLSSRRKSFPDAVFGIASTKRILRGCL